MLVGSFSLGGAMSRHPNPSEARTPPKVAALGHSRARDHRFEIAARLLFSLSLAFSCIAPSARAAPARTLTSADGRWAQVFPPGARRGHSAVYDPVHNQMLVFGGLLGTPQGAYSNDLWALHLDGTPTWEKLKPVGMPPSPRTGHSAIWDPVRQRMVVFGGEVGSNTYVNDLWALTFVGNDPTWTPLSTGATKPQARGYHAAVYDPLADRMLICLGGSNTGILNDVWALSLTSPTWTDVSPPAFPPGVLVARLQHVAVFDPAYNRLVIFGGRNGGSYLNDGYVLYMGGGDWQKLVDTGPPSGRYGASAFFDAANGRMLVFGGQGSTGPLNDTWTLPLNGGLAWAQLTPAGTPPAARSGHTAVFDPATDRMLVFGGGDASGAFSDVSELALESGSEWSPLIDPGNVPTPRNAHSAVFDTQRARMLIFGGANVATFLSDVATLSLSGDPVWSPLVPGGTPPGARSSQSAIYDPVRDRVIVFGGFDGGAGLGDTWELTLAGTPAWSPLTTSGVPPQGRGGHAAIYDPVRDRMLVLSGRSGALYQSDVWALSMGDSPTWTQLSPSGTPPGARAFHSAIYDPVRDRVVMFGGTGPSGFLNDAWALSLGGLAWTQLPATSPPPARQASAACYDPIADRMVLFGGYDGNTLYDDAWALSLASPAWSSLALDGDGPAARTGASGIYDSISDRMLVFGGRTAIGSSNESWSLYFAGSGRLGVNPPGSSAGLWLAPARPNPSRADAVIEFALPTAGQATLSVFDLSGRAVRTLVSGTQPAGRQSIRWDRRTVSGSLAPAGVYFYALNAGGTRLTRRAVLMP